MAIHKITVRMVVDSVEIKRGNFQLVDGRLRVPQLQDFFKVKHIEWIEEDVILGVRDDGLSDCTFCGGEIITISNNNDDALDGAEPIQLNDDNDDYGSMDSLSISSDDEGRSNRSRSNTPSNYSPYAVTPAPSAPIHTQPTTTSPSPLRLTTPPPPQGPSSCPTSLTRSITIGRLRSNTLPTLATTSTTTTTTATTTTTTNQQQHRQHPPLPIRHNTVANLQSTWKKASVELPAGAIERKPIEFAGGNVSNLRKRRDSSMLSPTLALSASLEPTPTSMQPDSEIDFCYKLIIVGEAGCGKTSLIRRYVHNKFSRHYQATVGVDFFVKELRVSEQFKMRLQLWDVAGQERFGAFTRVYFKGAVGGAIVFDVTNPRTLAAAAKWKEDIDEKVQLENNDAIPVLLVGNKSDLAREDTSCTPEYLDTFCKQNGFIGWFFTSCVLNHNIAKAFQYLGNIILENDKKYPSLHENDQKQLKLDLSSVKNFGDNSERSCCQG